MNADKKLAKIAAIYETIRPNEDGSFTTNHARYNLMGALINMERTGKADMICLTTVRSVCEQLGKIEKVLGL